MTDIVLACVFLFAFAAFWVCCSIFTYGALLANLQNDFPYSNLEEDMKFAIGFSLFGPIGLASVLMTGGWHGLRWKDHREGR